MSRSQFFDSKYLENGDRYEVGRQGGLFWKQPWAFDWQSDLTLDGDKGVKNQYHSFWCEMCWTVRVTVLNRMNMTLGHTDSSRLDVLPKIFSLLVYYGRRQFWGKSEPRVGQMSPRPINIRAANRGFREASWDGVWGGPTMEMSPLLYRLWQYRN